LLPPFLSLLTRRRLRASETVTASAERRVPEGWRRHRALLARGACGRGRRAALSSTARRCPKAPAGRATVGSCGGVQGLQIQPRAGLSAPAVASEKAGGEPYGRRTARQLEGRARAHVLKTAATMALRKYSKPMPLDVEDRLRRVLLRAQVIIDEAMGRHITNQAMLLQLVMLRDAMH